ncbi:MAG: acetyl-CoA carboxylase biotin carboxyl carrier protein subunit [Vicinamibacterales bacterium]
MASRDGVWVFVDGDTFLVALPPEGGSHTGAVPGAVASSFSRKNTSADPAGLAAPMPASVVAINVQPGDTVKAGDVLILLEAMKMELAIKAPRDGQVTAIHCRAGELVQPGVPLIELA